ncbi:non-canonical purine NTP pyrophosphatase [Loigolactobacillus zhaoyuanensis]|uniref:non-canonical purine NTP pyrophosphatase n=1 Tax=Loigolactobacillus zhaoyuanensis TaxID=2486017 RepID=UPI000F747526|nr:non-canonical purine NTP pyrophosphatase [Loigolactobacillus zhaoyuanensis]
MLEQPILLASHNTGKLAELRELFSQHQISLRGYTTQIPKLTFSAEGADYWQNAASKAAQVAAFCQLPVLGDDSGLDLAAFPGEFGVYTARTLAQQPLAANDYLLERLKNIDQRTITLHSYLVLQIGARRLQAHGSLTAQVGLQAQGSLSGGFDRLVYIPQLGQTLAQLPAPIRAQYSHRGRAVAALLAQL